MRSPSGTGIKRDIASVIYHRRPHNSSMKPFAQISINSSKGIVIMITSPSGIIPTTPLADPAGYPDKYTGMLDILYGFHPLLSFQSILLASNINYVRFGIHGLFESVFHD
jgi:hypothetical protein